MKPIRTRIEALEREAIPQDPVIFDVCNVNLETGLMANGKPPPRRAHVVIGSNAEPPAPAPTLSLSLPDQSLPGMGM